VPVPRAVLADLEVPTERLVLRPWRRDDLGVLAQAATDPYIASITSVPVPYTVKAGQAFLARMAELSAGGATVPRAVEEKATGTVVGHVSLRLRDLDLGRAALGYWMLPSARGRGLAREAVAGLTEWAFERLGVWRAELCIEPWNEASKRVAVGAAQGEQP
jgi:ribosomal-protein-alanine N-acetyltransferase